MNLIIYTKAQPDHGITKNFADIQSVLDNTMRITNLTKITIEYGTSKLSYPYYEQVSANNCQRGARHSKWRSVSCTSPTTKMVEKLFASQLRSAHNYLFSTATFDNNATTLAQILSC